MAVASYSLVVVITCLGIIATSTTQAPLVTNKAAGCEQQYCGSVSIAFPFGIGSHCSLDKWFELVCDKSTHPPRLFHNHTRLEVLNITLTEAFDQYIRVRSPISFYNCKDKKLTRKPLNLEGSPFSYSGANEFIAVSCGDLTMMESSVRYGSKTSLVGCKSTCSTRNKTGSNVLCNEDTHCCQASIPSRFKSFEISFYNINTTTAAPAHDVEAQSSKCKFAFFVEPDFLSSHENTSTTDFIETVRKMDYVPVILNLELNRSYFDLFKTPINYLTTPSLHCYTERTGEEDGAGYYIAEFSAPTFTNHTKIGLCTCNDGFEGNPYLMNGCKDIDECDQDRHNCHHGSTCVNTYGSYHCNHRRKYILIGVGSAIGALVLLFGTWGLYIVIKKTKDNRRKKRFFKQNGGLLLEQEIYSDESNVEKTKIFKSNELEKATNQFSIDRILGQGGQGTVYKGMLEDGKIVAVKKSKVIDEANKLSEFINELVILSQINHRNVVKLLGCCLETKVPLLVYEFIPNGTLSQYIHDTNDEFPLTWKIRLRIATEVAAALSYLHSAAAFPIYHRDIKSTNILLDDKYRAKVADFGTSRTISIEQTHLTTLVYGTFGYLDPEYFQSGQFTDKSDVYSFGVVLIELLTGQRVISKSMSEEGINLASFFIMTMEQDGLFDIVAAQILEDDPREEIVRVADLARRCLHLSGRNRPTMKEVAMELEGIQRLDRANSKVQQNYEELIQYVETELIEPWDVTSTSIGSADSDNTASRALLQQELPQLPFQSL